jgi:DNA-binding response OmpR family regulator
VNTGALRILVVEDDPDSRELLERLLERHQHIVVTADSVAAALHAARSSRIDMVISDINLPDGDGCKLMRTLREMTGAPAIAVSGHVDDEHRRRTAEAGVCVHLCKPIAFAKLLEAIEECRSEIKQGA